MTVGLVDYGAGNYVSVANALRYLDVPVIPVRGPEDLTASTHVVLPGVGAFGSCRRRLDAAGLTEPILELVAAQRVPFLGICVGMQLLATVGREFGDHAGLGVVPGEVRRLDTGGLRLPHVGWNVVEHRDDPLFHGLGERPTFYFVHSFHLVPDDASAAIAHTGYGERVTAAVRAGRTWGVQFHPEKSQQAGLRLLRNFITLETG